MVYRFGAYELNPETGELRRSGVRVKLGGQPLEVLARLVERPGELVTREELRQALWPDETYTDFDHGVNTAVQRIRRALGDSATSPRFVETLPRKGYRFVAPVETASPEPHPSPSPLPVSWVFAGGGAVVLALLAAFAAFAPRGDPLPVEKFVLAPDWEVHDPAVSPDGRRVAFVTFEDGGALWVRDLEGEAPRRMPDSEGARKPFWSPDSLQVAFGARDSLWRGSAEGGQPPERICRLSASYEGGSWSPDGSDILFGHGPFRVPADGGKPALVPLEKGGYRRAPHWLPILGRRVALLDHMTATDNSIVAIDLDSGVETNLGRGRRPVYASSGHLVFEDAGPASRIWAQSFALESLEVTSERFLVVDGAFAPSVSQQGDLVYLRGDSGSQERLVWRDRDGAGREVVSPPLPEARFLNLSPQGDRAALTVVEDGRRSVYVMDVERPLDEAQALAGPNWQENASFPHWSDDGERIAYSSFPAGRGRQVFRPASVWVQDLAGLEPVRAATLGAGILSDYRSLDEAEQLLVHRPAGPARGPWIIAHGALGKDGIAQFQDFRRPAEDDGFQVCAKVSPDGRFVAYIGGRYQGGRMQSSEILVRTYPDGRGPWRVSRPGEAAKQPRWSPAGDEIFYVAATDQLIAAKIKIEPHFAVVGYEELFRSEGLTGHAIPMYDASPDGRRILLLEPAPVEEPQLWMSRNWFEEFRGRGR